MNKKFEYVDDNPGAYFGMLAESLNESNDYSSEVKDYNIYAIKKDGSSTLVKTIHGTIRDVEDEIISKFSYLPKLSFIKRIEVRDNNTGEKVYDESLKEDYYDKRLVQKLYDMWFSKEQSEWLAKNAKDYAESLAYGHTTTDDLIEAEEYVNSKMKKQEAIKEDKFVSRDKMSKKDRKELDSQKRNTWGNTNPVTRVQPNKKAYDRKRDKKELDESKELNEANYKRFKREPFDLFTTVRKKLGMRSKLETYYINGFGEVMLNLYMPKDNFFRLDFSHYTSSGYNRSRKVMSYDEIDNVSDELGLNSALKDMGAAKISKYWDSRLSESGISFLIPVRAAQKLKDEFESNEDNRESEYKTSIENVDISEYKPDKNILLDIKRYGVKGKIPPRSNIKNAKRALMYLYNALLCGSYNTDKFAYIAKEMGADVDIINALIEQVEPVSGAYLEDRIDKIIYGKTNM